MRKVVAVLLFVGGVGFVLSAQSGLRPSGTYKSAAEIDAELKASNPELGIVAGQSLQLAEDGDGRITVRRRLAGPNNASVHENLTEVYYIVEGSGRFATGGTLPDYGGDRTTGIKGGRSYEVKAGDWVVLPPGTPHWFERIDGSVKYVEVRIPKSE